MNFYDSNGNPIAYANEEGQIFLFDGRTIAYVQEESVYSYSGNHSGWFEDGWLIDHDGNHVLFSENSQGGPNTPMTKMPPMPAMPQMPPMPEMPEMPSMPPTRNLNWSSQSPQEFFELE